MARLFEDLREMVSEQFQFQELLYQMTKRDLLLRYKQTAMGFAWAIFMPLVNTAIFSVVFMRVAPINVGAPYPVFAYLGLLVWNLFASALRFSVSSLTSNTNLVTKVYFPREIFPFSAVIVSTVDFVTGALVLVALMVYYHVPVHATVLFIPVLLAVQIAFTAAVALVIAMANLFYRDVKYLFEVVITVWMFATSVLYPTASVGGRLGTILRLNPMTPIIDSYRTVLLDGHLPDFASFAGTVAVAVISLTAGWLWFHRLEFAFAENI